ncbi:MAG: hypothetical protein NTZ35_01485 [Ignavibacteriales bacterium]|nr:hypothetical protein [Ignavibacteriales bacterium]
MGTTATDRMTIERRALILITILKERSFPGSGMVMGDIIKSFRDKTGTKLAREQVHQSIKDLNSWKYSFGSPKPLPIIEVRHSDSDQSKVFYRLSERVPNKVWNELLREVISITLLKHGELLGIERLNNKSERFSAFVNLHLAFEGHQNVKMVLTNRETVLARPLALQFNGRWSLKFENISDGITDEVALRDIEKITLST